MVVREPQAAGDYADRTTAPVKSILIEIGQILGSFEGKFAISRSSRMSSGVMPSTGVRRISSNLPMVRFDISPASARVSAASCAAASASHLNCLVVAPQLDDCSSGLRRLENVDAAK